MTVSGEDIRQVLAYIDKIETYEANNRTKLFAINDLVWGILFLYAGVLDALLFGIARGDLSIIPWLISSICGLATSLFISINRRPQVLSPAVDKSYTIFSRVYKFLVILIILGWSFTTFLGFAGYPQFIMPWIGIMLGSSVLLTNRHYDYHQLSQLFNPRNGFLFIVPMAYLGAVINLLGYLLKGLAMQPYMGLVTGLTIGLGFVNSALQRKR